jgi:hypothetical protein
MEKDLPLLVFARQRKTTGALPAFATHLDCLETLATMSGRSDLTPHIQTLRAEAAALRLA